MKNRPVRFLVSASLLVAAQMLNAQSPSPSALTSPCPSPMTCPNRMGWAEGLIGANAGPKSVFPVNDTEIKKVKGVDHPDDCDFHEWSWEAFVWATAIGADGYARFRTLHNADELFGNKASTAAGKGPKPLILKPRDLKPTGGPQARSGDEAAQAGGGMIVDQNGQIVWYSTHMNDAYFNFVKANSGANYSKVPATKNFPVGAAVFKASWKVVGPGDDATKFYTEKNADVPMLVPNPCGGIMVDPSGATRKATVALVGLHVVGVTVNHPEFVWATFEQNNNAPNLPAGMDPTSANPVSPQGFSFYAANTAANKCNIMPTATGPNELKISDPVKQTVTPITNVFRLYATGNACPARTQDIVAANTASQQSLSQAGSGRYPNPAETVWANYQLIGTLWLNANTLKPGDKNMVAEGIGSVNLANATLETYFQGQHKGKNVSCFFCHSTEAHAPAKEGKNINISHVILGLIPGPPNPTPTPTCTPAAAPASAPSATPAASPTVSP
ncbi:MAG TPA: hypothetical protein VGW57_15600 [Chthoniobacterales bacterium]|nr:hypothetical protein [Chthoniobacterales bacterium]